jgi:hypothetical protein
MQNRPAAPNKFQARRNITHGMYDVALLMANILIGSSKFEQNFHN